jgi:hypothetical protein
VEQVASGRFWEGRFSAHFRQLISFVVLPNLPFLLLRFFVPADRAIISLDYLAIGVLATAVPGGSSLLIIVLFMAVFILDIIKTFAGIYYFSFTDAIGELVNLVHVSLWLTLPRLFLVLGIACLVSWAAVKISRKSQGAVSLRVVCATLVVFGCLSFVSSAFTHQIPIADSNVLSEVRDSYSMLNPEPAPPTESVASTVIPAYLEQNKEATKVVLIVVEAMGLSENPAITDKILSPLLEPDVRERYDVSRGSVAFWGPTLLGEMREFCQLKANPQGILIAKPETGQSCIPNQLRKAGFTTTAIHGYTKEFFNRSAWYPTVGFEHSIFNEELGTSAGTCGSSFEGSCDPALAEMVRKMLMKSPKEKQFIYWLTLNSHEPVSDETAKRSKLHCEDLPKFGGQDVCNMVRVQYDTNQAIQRLVTANGLPDTLFVIVGDHAPPLFETNERNAWDQRRVPWVILTPKHANAPTISASLMPQPETQPQQQNNP